MNLQLPPKNNHIVLCRLTKLQQEVYARLLKLNNVEVMLTADDLCRCGTLARRRTPFSEGQLLRAGMGEGACALLCRTFSTMID